MLDALDMTRTQATAVAPSAGSATQKDRAMQAALDFEAVFLADAFKTMAQGLGTDPLDGGGTGSQNWRELLMDEYAKTMVKQGGIGLAEPIARELLRIQEDHPQ